MRWLFGCLIVGLALRFCVIAVVDVRQLSDYATYAALAEMLLETGQYESAGTVAHWPPGLPLVLAGTAWLTGDIGTAILVLNTACFAATLGIAFALAKQLAGGRAARFVVLLLAVWPNYVLVFGLAHKEQLAIALVTGAVLLYLSAARAGRRQSWLKVILSGLVLGYASLTQPSLLLFGLVFLVFEVLTARRALTAAGRVGIVFVMVALCQIPWALRNQAVLGEFVVGTTSSGYVLLIANNPLAYGGYMPPEDIGLVELSGLGEVEASRRARAAAIDWITDNPGAFVVLALQKQILFLGDDAIGAYDLFRRGLEDVSSVFLLAKGTSNVFWIAVMGLVLLSLWSGWRTRLSDKFDLSIIMLPVFYSMAIHSVFESNGRHHFTAMVFIAIIASLLVSERNRGVEEDSAQPCSSGTI